VQITNAAYLPKMSLSEWKLFDNSERFSLYKESELKVNNLNADIAKVNTANQNMLSKLEKGRQALADEQSGVQKERLRLRLVDQQQKEQKEEVSKKAQMLKNGQNLIKQAILKEKELVRAK
jgi:hypothetical protein